MAVLRVRDVVYLARDGVTVTVTGSTGLTWDYTLDMLVSETTPEEWIPVLASRDAWVAGQYEIDRAAAQRIANIYNASQPWEPQPTA